MSHTELVAIISACFCALMSVSTIALMSHALRKARKARDGAPIDDPGLDATDAAHPAWWRGTDHAAARWHIRTQEAELERDKLRARLKRTRTLVEFLTIESSIAREELRKFKARRRLRVERLARPILERRNWSWERHVWNSTDPNERNRSVFLEALKCDHEEVMTHLRERARLP